MAAIEKYVFDVMPLKMKKQIYAVISALFISFTALAQSPNIGIGTSKPDAKAILDIFSIEKGLLIPRLTNAARNNIQPNATAVGLLIYNTTSNTFNFWNGNNWEEVGFSGILNSPIKWFDGTSAPTIGTGVPLSKDGDYYINNTTAKVYKKTGGAWVDMNLNAPQGAQGRQGITGTQGNTGTTWFANAGTPTTNSVPNARDDDYYLDINDGNVYQKTSAGWNNPIINIKGISGLPGARGATGSVGAQGDSGAIWFNGAGTPTTNSVPNATDDDYYLDINDGNVYQKTPAGWNNPVTNIKGNSGTPGAAGATGTRGNTWFYDAGQPTAANSTGSINDDYYLDTNSGDIYQKVAGRWDGPILSIKGPSGTAGGTGAKWYNGPSFPPPATISPTDDDYYLDNQTKNIYKYSSATWVSVNVNIMGPAGSAGASGATGTSAKAFKSVKTNTSDIQINYFTSGNTATGLAIFSIEPMLGIKVGDQAYVSVDGNLPGGFYIGGCWVSNDNEVTVKILNNVQRGAPYPNLPAGSTFRFGFIKP